MFLFCHQALYLLIMSETLLILIYSQASLYTGRLEKIHVFSPTPSQAEKIRILGNCTTQIQIYFIALLLRSQEGNLRVQLTTFYKSLLTQV